MKNKAFDVIFESLLLTLNKFYSPLTPIILIANFDPVFNSWTDSTRCFFIKKLRPQFQSKWKTNESLPIVCLIPQKLRLKYFCKPKA